jgi:glyoxylase-like metal-dependent hydrolase (beta-lactamase superfamily II)
MLEDDYTYVLRKALVGADLSPEQAGRRAGLSEADVYGFLDGRFSPETARLLAPVLGLGAAAFARHASYHPQPLALPEIERLDLPFGREQVNAWLIHTGHGTILFDAGHEPRDLTRRLAEMPRQVFITHAHRDHTGAIDHFLHLKLPVHAAGIPRTQPLQPGATRMAGALKITACDLAGHASPALGYHIDGLAVPVLVTGDALFAGSIGGCASPALYQTALRNLHAALDPLPDTTVLLPGHGPATTLGEERAGNPFLAGA